MRACGQKLVTFCTHTHTHARTHARARAMEGLDTQSNAGLRIIGSRGHNHVILISSWLRTISGHVNIRVFAVCPLGVKLAPDTSDRAVPFRQNDILIINSAHINIGLCCSVINNVPSRNALLRYIGVVVHYGPRKRFCKEIFKFLPTLIKTMLLKTILRERKYFYIYHNL